MAIRRITGKEMSNVKTSKETTFKERLQSLMLFQSGQGDSKGNWTCSVVLIVKFDGELIDISGKLPEGPQKFVYAKYTRDPKGEKVEILEPGKTGLSEPAEQKLQAYLKTIFS